MMPARETGSMIAREPHYEIAAAELAAWIEEQGTDLWWTVDGDPLLTGYLSLPAPGDELAAKIRWINRPLLVSAKNDPDAHGQVITRERLDDLVGRKGDDWPMVDPKPAWADDREFTFCWKGKDVDWLLLEDSWETVRAREDLLEASGEE